MITFDSNPETDAQIKKTIAEAFAKNGGAKTYKNLNDMLRCANKRKHAAHIEFAEKALEYYEVLMVNAIRSKSNKTLGSLGNLALLEAKLK